MSMATTRRAGSGPAGLGLAGLLAVAVAAGPVALAAGGAAEEAAGSWVRLRDRRVFEVREPDGARSAPARAREASEALARAVGQPAEATAEAQGAAVLLRVGDAPVLRVTPTDAAAGEPTPAALAARLAGEVNEALRLERRRLALQHLVFSFSLTVFSGLVAFLLVRRLGVLETLLERWLAGKPDRVPRIAIRGVEVASHRAVRGALDLALRAGQVLAQIAVVYAWLLFALSLFERTRGVGGRLSRLLLAPAAEVIARLGGAVPVLVLAAVVVGAVALLLRTLRLFLESVARGDTHLSWLPADLAPAVSALARLGLVVLALAFGAELSGGAEGGPLGRLGWAAVLAAGLATVPLLASLLAGIPAVFGRRIRVGDVAELAGRSGRVQAVSLLEIRLGDREGGDVRVSHLAALAHPVRISAGPGPLGRAEVTVAPDADPERVRALLLEAAGGEGAAAELLALDASGARWAVRGPAPDLGARAASALRAAGVRLGGRG